MGILDCMKEIPIIKNSKLTLSVYKKWLCLSFAVSGCLGNPNYIKFYCDEFLKVIAIKGCDENEENSIKLVVKDNTVRRVTCINLSNTISRLINFDFDAQESFNVDGQFIIEENIVVFDLKTVCFM